MTDLTLDLLSGGLTADLKITANDLATDDGLRSAVALSLFTDRLARADDPIPDGTLDRRGWWGDVFPVQPGDGIGSRLWLLSREKQVPEVLARAKQYAEEGLRWLLEDGVADAVEVVVTNPKAGWLLLEVGIIRTKGGRVDLRYDYAWAAEAVRGS